MRALVFTDIHIKPDNIHQVDLLYPKLKKIIRMKSIDNIIILGDILHSHERLNVQCLNRACKLIRDLEILIEGNVYLLVGNHDMIDSSQYLSNQHWMMSLKEWDGVIVCDNVMEIEDGDIVFCPYVQKGRFIEALNTYEKWKDSKVIFAHQEVRGCKYNGKVSTSEDIWLEEYPQLISGHIHLNQRYKNIYFPGSVQQVSYGEGDKNVVVVVDTSQSLEYEEIELTMPKKITFEVNIHEISEMDIEKYKPKVNSIRIILNGNGEDFKAIKKSNKYKELTKEGVKIIFKGNCKQQVKKVEKVDKFMDILELLIRKENNKYLTELFNENSK